MLFQYDYSLDTFGPGVLVTILILVFIIFNVYIYRKARRWILILIMFLFSVIFSAMSFDYEMPFSPFLQIFYILISFVIFILTSIEAYNKK